jgi:hypothetical protein
MTSSRLTIAGELARDQEDDLTEEHLRAVGGEQRKNGDSLHAIVRACVFVSG